MKVAATLISTSLFAFPSRVSGAGLASFNDPKTVTLKSEAAVVQRQLREQTNPNTAPVKNEAAGAQRQLREQKNPNTAPQQTNTNTPPLKSEAAGAQRQLTEQTRRLMHLTFEECVGKHVNICKGIINAAHAANPAAFDNVAEVLYETVKVRDMKSYEDIALNPDVLLTINDYNLVGLRTDETETYVLGIAGDGVVSYPYPWCLTIDNCVDVGPWDCYFEETTPPTKYSVAQCCNVIKANVPYKDVHGNYLECYASPPPPSQGSEEYVNLGRVFLHVSNDNKVVHPPVNG